jgi:hypothetical protein
MSGRLAADLRAALDPAALMRAAGLIPEPWQETLLRERPRRALLCCCRQAGKSTTAATAAIHDALYTPGAIVLMLSLTQRQSSELLRKAREQLHQIDPTSTQLNVDSQHTLELSNGSRIISLPGREDTIRGYSSVRLLIFDEAAWVSDDIYQAARPMLAVSAGRLLALSTPNGQQGWFYRAWVSDEDWNRTRIRAADCPRIQPSFLAEERQTMTASRYASEYDCEFSDAVDSVFYAHDVNAAIDPELTPLYAGGW